MLMLSREIGSSLFGRYIIPAALDLFTNQGAKISNEMQVSAQELQEVWGFFSPSELASICLTFEIDGGGRKKKFFASQPVLSRRQT